MKTMKKFIDEIIKGIDEMEITEELNEIENLPIREMGIVCDYSINKTSNIFNKFYKKKAVLNEYHISLLINETKHYDFSGNKDELIKRMKEVFKLNETTEE